MRKFIALILLVVPSSLFAWGNVGHRVVARIAAAHLKPAASAEVARLLGNEELVDIATRADAIRNQRPETKEWHFADVPREEAAYDASRDCENDDCVVARVDEFAQILGDKTKSDADRKEALMFLTHFVGDLHQPLHCATGTLPNGKSDRGGNGVLVSLPGQSKKVNLHSVWDGSIIASEGLSENDLVEHLSDDIIDIQDEKLLTSGSTIDWANAAHKLAVDRSYNVPKSKKLSATYMKNGRKTVDQQLAVAGLRLAKLINDALATP